VQARNLLAITALTLLCACGTADSPEEQVRQTIAAVEKAAEARDVGDVMEHVSPHFRDAEGRGAEELARYVRGYFIAHQSIHLLTRIDRIEFPTPQEARVQLTVAMVGRDADAANAWDLAGEIRDFRATLLREDGEWRATYLEIQR
jgi:hypothetical protein